MTEWILIAAAALIIFLILKIIKKTVSLFFTVATVVGIALLILGFFALQDAQDFQENFGNSTSLFIQAENDTYLTAIAIDMNSTESGFEPYEDNITRMTEEGEIPPEYYKLFIIKKEAFNQSEMEPLDLGIGELEKDELIRAMYSDEPSKAVAEEVSNSENTEAVRDQIIRMYDSEEELRRTLFGSALMSVFGKDPMNLIGGVKDGNILIRPEPLMFKTIDLVPEAAFKTAGDIVGNETKEES